MGEPMHGIILIMDNDAGFLHSTARLFEVEDYRVLRASTIEEAQELLQTRRIHLGIFDIRMVEEGDSNDLSGLMLARDPAFAYIPKLILTAYPSYEYVRDAMGTMAGSLPPAVNFIGKKEGPDRLLEAVEQAFQDHVRINAQLKIHWTDPTLLSFTGLAAAAEPYATPDWFADRAGAYEDLFRKLFYDYQQITFARLLWQMPGRAAVALYAYGNAEEQYIVTVGERAALEQERRRFRKTAPPGFSAVLLDRELDTQHVSAAVWSLPGQRLDAALPFPDFFNRQTDKPVRQALEGLLNTSLAPWRGFRPDAAMNEAGMLPEQNASFTDPETATADWEKSFTALSAAARERGLARVSLVEGRLFIQFPNQSGFECPDPVAYLLEQQPWMHPDEPDGAAVGIGELDHYLVCGTEMVPTDFAGAGIAPRLYDFVALESGIRFRLAESNNLLSLYDFEKQLAQLASLKDNLAAGSVEPELRRALNAILAVRQSAAGCCQDHMDAYQQLNLLYTLPGLVQVETGMHLGERPVLRWLHRLLFAGLVCRQLAAGRQGKTASAETEKTPGIHIDRERQEIWANGKQTDLTPTEYKLLCYLHDRQGQICSYEEIIREVFGYADAGGKPEKSLVTTQVLRLRKKIEPVPSTPRYLVTVPGSGYRLEKVD